MSHFYFREFI